MRLQIFSNFLAFLLVAMLILSAIYFISDSDQYLLFDILISVCSSAVIVSCISSMNRLRTASSDEKELTTKLSSASFYNSNGIPLPKAIEISVKGDKSKISGSLTQISRALRMGSPFSRELQSNSLLFSFLSRSGSSNISGISAILGAREISLSERLAKIESSIQKYATANMFIGVLLPSFIMFAFIGSYVISGGIGSLWIMYVVMLAILPAVYSAASLGLSRRLYAV